MTVERAVCAAAETLLLCVICVVFAIRDAALWTGQVGVKAIELRELRQLPPAPLRWVISTGRGSVASFAY